MKALNGWQRLWIVLSIAYFIVIASYVYISRPPGIIELPETLKPITEARFLKDLRNQYPEYDDIPDKLLISKITAKYPSVDLLISKEKDLEDKEIPKEIFEEDLNKESNLKSFFVYNFGVKNHTKYFYLLLRHIFSYVLFF